MSVSEASVDSGDIAEDSVDRGAMTEGERRFNDAARPSLTPQQCISKYDAWATSYDKVTHSPAQFSSTWYLCARKHPYALHPVSRKFPQRRL